MNVKRPRAPDQVDCCRSPSWRMSESGGRRNSSTPRGRVSRPSQADDAEHEIEHGGRVLHPAAASPRPGCTVSSSATMSSLLDAPPSSPTPRTRCCAQAPSRTCCYQPRSARLHSRVPRRVARGRQVDGRRRRRSAGPRPHYKHAVREEDRLGDRVRDEHRSVRPARPRSAAARGSSARASSRRARRTACRGAGSRGRRPGRGRSRRAAACRRRAATARARSLRARRARAARRRARRGARGPGRAPRAGARCLPDRSPGAEPASWKTMPSRGRVAPGAAACRGRGPSPAVGRPRSPTIRSSVLLPQPDGPISETKSPARADVEVDALERDHPAAAELLA